MSIHFISPASVEFTRHVFEWRRQPWTRNKMMELSERQLVELRRPLADMPPSLVNVHF